jgi:multimeric flavodoxin WrbA
MNPTTSRRKFLSTAGTGAAAGVATGAAAIAARAPAAAVDRLTTSGKLRIIGISGSPRKGKTTAAALRVALEAAQTVAPEKIETELIELAELSIPGQLAAGLPLEPAQKDDFPEVAAKLTKPEVAAIIVGSPVYFGSMTALCKAFLDRCIALRMRQFALANKVAGAVAVGGVRNGGQELTLQTIITALLCHEMVIVGDGRPTCHWGATVWNSGKDDISQDEFGLATLKNLGRRVAEVALQRVAGQ